MITRIDIGDGLAMLAATAPDKTPLPNEATMAAWARYFDDHIDWTGDDLVASVVKLNEKPRERLVQPADLGEIIKALRRDRYERMDPSERESAWADIGNPAPSPRQLAFGGGYVDGRGVRRDRYGYVDKSVPEIEYPAEWSSDQRLRSYWERIRTGFADVPDPGPCPVEHPPGRECITRGCGKPSTFGDYCAQHYVLSGAWSKRGPTAVPATSLSELFERTSDEIL